MGFDEREWNRMRTLLDRFFEIKETLKSGKLRIHGIEFKIQKEVEKRLEKRLAELKAELKNALNKLLEAG